MIYIEAFLTALMVLLLVQTSISDLKTGKIPNKVIVVFVGIGVIGIIPYYALFAQDCLFSYLVNTFLAVGISIVLYSTGIWGAGDCKLLIATIALFPARLYCINNRSVASCFLLIALVFVVAFAYIVAETIFLGVKHQNLMKRTKIVLNIKTYLKGFLFFFFFINLCNVLLILIIPGELLADVVLLTAIHFVLLLLAMRIEPKASWLFVAIMAICWGLLIVFDIAHFSVSNINWKTYLVMTLLIAFRSIADKYNYRCIAASELKAGMILSVASVMQFSGAKEDGLPTHTTEDLKSRLSQEEVESVQRWSKAKKGREFVIIVRKIPFALFIAIGTLVFMMLEVLL